MEALLHYIWKHRIYPLHNMTTNKGESVEVIDPGLHNSNSGPDFFNAKIKVGGMLWVGNVEIHDKASDWFLHGHDKDAAYNNVVLHVVGLDDMPVVTQRGEVVRQMEMQVPQHVTDNYASLLADDKYPPCRRALEKMTKIAVHSWMGALGTERLEQKTEAIKERVARCGGSWEDAYFMTLARNFGFGANGEAFEKWASTLQLQSVAHHRDDIFQIETMFMGQAGMLDIDKMPERHRETAAADKYFCDMQREYKYLEHKFRLATMDAAEWKYMRLRPQNFPQIRIAQLANLYYNRRSGLSQLVECKGMDDFKELFSTRVTPYWQTHYSFGAESKRNMKQLSRQSVGVLIVNTAVPMLFAWGRHKGNEKYCQRALDLLEEMKAEENSITRMWQECGLDIASAADSQAIVQLKKNYCDRRDCLRCRFGYEYIKDNGWFVKESPALNPQRRSKETGENNTISLS